MNSIEDKIAKLCLDKYASLKKTGKPLKNEWTVLSGVVLQKNTYDLSVISLCTGTKCLSGVELQNIKYEERGNRLSDSHAEILSRRSFIKYLYYQIELTIIDQGSDIFYLEESNIKLKDVQFHFFTSQTPCGDCSIIPKINKFCEVVNSFKKLKTGNDSVTAQCSLEVIDIHRTGAKCLENNAKQDLYKEGVNYHTVGPLRTKPGRGDRTLSLSCSDKIAKWIIMGVQGRLLSLLIPTIKFETIIIGGGCPYSLESMQRGLYKRFDSNIKGPKIMQSTLTFKDIKGDLRNRPCPSSIVWCAEMEKEVEIAVNGLKQGATKKINKSYCLSISRKRIFEKFLKIYNIFYNYKRFSTHPKKITYYHCKQYSFTYQQIWKNNLKLFSIWPVKPVYLQECLSF